MSARPVLLIDGLNVFTRHFVVNPTMSDQGNHVGGLVGFLKAIRLLCDKTNPSQVIVAWEGGGSPRRRAIYPEYKHGRRPQKLNRFYSDIPDTYHNRDNQVSLIIESLRHVPIMQVYVSDCEADDVIGTLAKQAEIEGIQTYMMTPDKDFAQLVTKNTFMYRPGSRGNPNEIWDTNKVCEKFDIHNVHQVVDFLGMVGDAVDNIPGIAGVGPKTASKLLKQYNSIEKIFQTKGELYFRRIEYKILLKIIKNSNHWKISN